MFDLMDLCIKVDECKLCYEYVLHDYWEWDVLKETTMDNEKVVEGTQNGCVNFHRTSTLLVFTCLRPKQLSDPGMNFCQDGRWGGSSRVNEGMGQNVHM
jgi:hypothetical protein